MQDAPIRLEETEERNQVRLQDECREKEWVRPRIEFLKEYDINIRFLSIGCVIRVGCKEIPFPTIKEGISALTDYIRFPEATIKIWNEKFIKEEDL